MQKVAGVTTVKVTLNDGLVVLDLAAENAVTLTQLRQVIRNNGFVSNESRVVARGAITQAGGATFFEIRNSRDRVRLTAALPAATDVVVTGTVNTRDPQAMTLTGVTVEAK